MKDAPALSFKPDSRVQKILLSSPAKFTGEFASSTLLLGRAWPALLSRQQAWSSPRNTSLNRTVLVLAFSTMEETPAPGHVVPNYEPAAEMVAAILSVFYGKRFDVHGPTEMSGYFNVPDLLLLGKPYETSLRSNDNRERVDWPSPLKLEKAKHILPLTGEGNNDTARDAERFRTASRFYNRALRTVDDDPEVAYLHLITAIEIVAAGAEVSERGDKARYLATAKRYLPLDFFDKTEAEHDFESLKATTFDAAMKAAYDLRSRLVHRGTAFGRWIQPMGQVAEMQSGKPIVESRRLAKLLAAAPLFAGLERVTRATLLGFASERFTISWEN